MEKYRITLYFLRQGKSNCRISESKLWHTVRNFGTSESKLWQAFRNCGTSEPKLWQAFRNCGTSEPKLWQAFRNCGTSKTEPWLTFRTFLLIFCLFKTTNYNQINQLSLTNRKITRMKINNLNLKNLRNEEHFQFQTDFRNLLNSSNPVALNVEAALAAYNPIYTYESEAR